MTSVTFKSHLAHLDVLCVKLYANLTLAGIGSNLFVYLGQSLLLSQPIFVGERVHSINIKNDLIFIKGGRQLACVKLKNCLNSLEYEFVSKIETSDWIQVVVIFENNLAGLVTAHNFFEYWDIKKNKQLNVHSCEEKCILYSCNTVGESLEGTVVFAGTVFGEVLVWSPLFRENTPFHRLKAHNGAVFSIEIKPNEKLLATTSDDRSLKIWSINSNQPLLTPENWKYSNIQLIHTLFGHTARVWKSLILKNYYLTTGEDSQLIVWNNEGKATKSLFLHQDSGIRGLDYSENGIITTGGEDGGINAIPIMYLTTENIGKEILDLGQSASTKVSFCRTGLVCTLNGSCAVVSYKGEWKVIYKNDNFDSYCILEVSRDGDHIVMGSINGFLVVINTCTKAIVAEEQIVEGRIYSVHYLDHLLLTCGPGGRLDVWELSNGSLKNVANMSLPDCKERWTTCGAVENERLVVGDRMGNVHIYKLEGGTLLKSFRKIHSYLGVTDIKIVNGECLSAGRDGTVKEFRNLTHSMTCRLPMEWPWKIVNYEDDILILGFHGVSFQVFSMENREVIASHECGGGHRSCDYSIHKNKLSFLYVKEKKVYVVDLALDGVTRIRRGFHGKEINCLEILQNDPMVIATGSEDTTVRITSIDKSEQKPIAVLKTHVSSVRTIATCPTKTGRVIVSAGGKGQIVVWDFDSSTLKCREVVNHRLRKETQNWKCQTPAVDPETRIMCADILDVEEGFLVATGCSDCQVRMFSYDGSLNQLNGIGTSHCVLKVKLLTLGPSRVLLSAGTDGKVAFWDVTDCFNVVSLGVFPVHQSGINSLQFQEVGIGKFILATGGDDNAISVGFVQIEGGEVTLRRMWETNTIHSCQITGMKILENFLISTSIDQRITIWKWSWSEEEFKTEFLNQTITAVPDIQGMDATWLDESTISIVVHGKGMEVLKIQLENK